MHHRTTVVMNMTHLQIHYTLIHYITGSTHITQDLHPYQVHIENRRPYRRVNNNFNLQHSMEIVRSNLPRQAFLHALLSLTHTHIHYFLAGAVEAGEFLLRSHTETLPFCLSYSLSRWRPLSMYFKAESIRPYKLHFLWKTIT